MVPILFALNASRPPDGAHAFGVSALGVTQNNSHVIGALFMPTSTHCNLSIDPAIRQDAGNRLRSVRGHVDGILRMLEREDVYCIDVLRQLKAVQGAIAKTSDQILRGHLKHHVVNARARGDEDAIIEELMEILKYK